jgi:regulatory protein
MPRPTRASSPPPPLDAAAIERLALGYVGRYATTRAKLATYLRRKLRERGWAGEGVPPVEAVTERMAELRYLDDRAFAEGRTEALLRRGFGARRIALSLRAAGVEGEAAALRPRMEEGEAEAALAFARRRKLGPFAMKPTADPAARRRALGAMLRAGHGMAVALGVLGMSREDLPES